MSQIIDKLAYIFTKDGKVLVTLSKGKDVWYIPGGKREVGETDEEALLREVKEELSVDLIPETLEFYGSFTAAAHGKAEGVVVQMTCYTGSFEGVLTAANEIADFAMFEFSQMHLTSIVDHLIFQDLKNKGLIR